MGRIKLDQDSAGFSAVMEKMTGALVKDCFQEGSTVYFIVAPGNLGKAVGRKGSNCRKVQERLGKSVRVIEYSSTPARFVENCIYPLAVEQIVEEQGSIVIKESQRKIKGAIIGRNGTGLKVLNRAVRRFFGKDVKVE